MPSRHDVGVHHVVLEMNAFAKAAVAETVSLGSLLERTRLLRAQASNEGLNGLGRLGFRVQGLPGNYHNLLSCRF